MRAKELEVAELARVPESSSQRLHRWCIATAILLGALSAWLARHDMSSDGISYLDLGSAAAQGRFEDLINGYWNPLYPLLLGVAFRVFQPSPFWEFSIAHLVSFGTYLLALGGFAFFLSGLKRLESLNEASLTLIGYALFLWTSLRLISLSLVNPDMLVAGFLYLAAGCILRVRREPENLRWFLLLGLALGLGYLAKSPFFAMAPVFLGVSVAATGGIRAGWRGGLIAATLFACLSLPYAAAISSRAGRPTFGESSRLNWAWSNGGTPTYHWQGGDQFGLAAHPTRKLNDDPPLFEFDGPLTATYAPWFDPSYWYAGVGWTWSAGRILINLRDNMATSWNAAIVEQLQWLVLSLTLWLAGSRVFRLSRESWLILVPALFGFALYLPIHVEPRMLGAFITLFWLGVLAGSEAWRSSDNARWIRAGCFAAALASGLQLGGSYLGELLERGPRHLLRPSDSRSHFEWQVAQGMRSLGLETRDKIAWIRPQPFTSRQSYYWAHLAGLRIIAEVPAGREASYWNSGDATRSTLHGLMARVGAKALIATRLPDGADRDGWISVPGTAYYIYRLNL